MRKYISHVFIGILLIFIVYQCESSKENKQLSKKNMEALTDSITHYKNKLGTITASKKTLQLEKDQLKEVLLDKDEELAALAKEFSSVKSVVKYEQVTKFDTIRIPFDTPIVTPEPFERTGAKFTDWYSLGYKVSNDSLVIEPFETWTETTVITGFKKKWFLGEKTLTTDITNSNPYIDVIEIKSAEVVIPKYWYEKWYVWLAAGITGGLLIR